MIASKYVSNFNRISATLILGSAVSLAGSLLIARPTSAAISDHWLDRIRGSNPMVGRRFVDTCTDENVAVLNTFSKQAVSWSNCAAGFIPGVICISCNSNNNFTDSNGRSNWGQVDTNKQNFAVDCGTNNGGMEGTCALDSNGDPFCSYVSAYSCTTFGIDFPLQ
jgi:hypothetical protein